jgi:hypothetical protein
MIDDVQDKKKKIVHSSFSRLLVYIGYIWRRLLRIVLIGSHSKKIASRWKTK